MADEPATGTSGRRRFRLRGIAYLRALGPSLISGASDNDPTTVGTMTVLGSTTVYALSWLTILLFPMLAAIQMISAQVGVVCQDGLEDIVRRRWGRGWGLVLLVSVAAVSVVTIAADIEGGAAALGILVHVSFRWLIVPFALAMLAVLLFGSYPLIERILRYVLLIFAAYIVSAILAQPDWGAVLRDTLIPSIRLDQTYIEGALALLGTTLTSYAYVWETIEEAQERPPISSLGLARADAGIGMVFAVSIFWFTLISAGATLGVHHLPVHTAEEAARSLVPVAGPLAGDVFALGLLASASMAVPVLAATTGYMVGEELNLRAGLSERIWEARAFYAVVALTVLLGIAISFLGISPLRLLFVSGLVGGLGTPISLVFLLLAARDRRVMGDRSIGPWLTVIGWSTAALITATSLYFLWQQIAHLA